MYVNAVMLKGGGDISTLLIYARRPRSETEIWYYSGKFSIYESLSEIIMAYSFFKGEFPFTGKKCIITNPMQPISN